MFACLVMPNVRRMQTTAERAYDLQCSWSNAKLARLSEEPVQLAERSLSSFRRLLGWGSVRALNHSQQVRE